MQDLTAEVLATTAGAADDRVRTVLDALVRHLHAFVRDIAPTEAEWAQAIDFLTRTGQLCTPQRQEFVLLSDVLGVTMLVDEVNRRGDTEATENSVLGPFFRTARPAVANGSDISGGVPGVPLQVELTVRSATGRPVPGAQVDVWHSDGDGHYDVDVPGLDGAAAMRGLFTADARGRVWFSTIAPAAYPIPSDGPVGELMRAAGRSAVRPAHLHVRVEAPDHATVTSMLFRDDDPNLGSDPVFGVRDSLVARYRRIDTTDGPAERLSHEFVLDPLTRH